MGQACIMQSKSELVRKRKSMNGSDEESQNRGEFIGFWSPMLSGILSIIPEAPQTHNEAILQLLQLGMDTNLGLGLIVDHRTALWMRNICIRLNKKSEKKTTIGPDSDWSSMDQ
ncbi:hypothetical protein EYF80_048680 [Liparis tanakae]|uniref:Uncharacterized protein n=1 Tax=Liparis tanakae TaxID=230148 RepID=A0A4Z2FJL1_9TELE|nr:hypothetical protein EYF80_048680 [Liparis tanakae]